MTDPKVFPRCKCWLLRCACSGGIHSFAPSYKALLRKLRPRKIFEWGPGESTRIALETPSVATVVSIEQNPRWLPAIEDPRWEAHVIRHRDARYVDLHGHDDADVFFIDSRRRAECLEIVRAKCKPDAVVCLHDAQRPRYQRALARYRRVEFLDFGFAVAAVA